MPLTKRIATNHTKEEDDNIRLHRLDILLVEDELAMRLEFQSTPVIYLSRYNG
jgi:hypothetical protein